MIKIGRIQKLKICKEDKSGYYLLCKENEEVFMPGSLTSEDYEIGTDVNVFVWVDKDGSELATPNLPKYEVGDFALLEVTNSGPNGLFLDLEIPKDIIVPKKMTLSQYEKGDLCLVMLMLDEDDRIYGTTKLDQHFKSALNDFKKREIINFIPYKKTPLGFKILIENQYGGMIYKNEIFENVTLGKKYQGSVKSIRDDGLIDAFIKKVGKDGVEDDMSKIRTLLVKNNGSLPLTDKSSPEEIKEALQMSKKAFKKAVGTLYKNREITLNGNSIEIKKRP
jgi:predicted RNA-binding protein (virulence factor B family)